MNASQQVRKGSPQVTLIQKMNPARFPRMSGVMAALVGFVLGTDFVEPPIVEISVTSDGFVLARIEGEAGADHFLGRYSHLMRNWLRLVAAAGLSTGEYAEAMALFAAKIGFFGQTAA